MNRQTKLSLVIVLLISVASRRRAGQLNQVTGSAIRSVIGSESDGKTDRLSQCNA